MFSYIHIHADRICELGEEHLKALAQGWVALRRDIHRFPRSSPCKSHRKVFGKFDWKTSLARFDDKPCYSYAGWDTRYSLCTSKCLNDCLCLILIED